MDSPHREPDHDALNRGLNEGLGAARLLADSCQTDANGRGSTKSGVVGGLARSLATRMEDLRREARDEEGRRFVALLASESALLCADIATLAVCNPEDLEEAEVASRIVRATEDAVRRLSDSVPEPDPEEAPAIQRDLRSAAWKVSVAKRQV